VGDAELLGRLDGGLMLDQYRSTLANVAGLHPMLHIALVHHRNTRGQPLSFRDKPYLVELYTDLPRQEEVVLRKAVQTGVSELCIQLAFERSGWSGRIVAYVLPSHNIRNRFVQKRIDPLLQHVPAYRERHQGSADSSRTRGAPRSTGNLALKQFGDGSILFLGSNTPGNFVEFSADTLIIDEFDQCDPGNLAKARDRLRASPYPQEVRLGNPTLPRVGISRLYDESDQRRWFHRCTHCGHRGPLDWWANVVELDDDGHWQPRDRARAQYLRARGIKHPTPAQDVRPVCIVCRQPFDRQPAGGLWVPAFPDRVVRGYSMSRLDVLSDSLWALYREWLEAQGNSERLATFYCSVLGIPYEFSGARITHAMLGDACTAPALDYLGGPEYGRQVVTAGIDVGTVLNVSISTTQPPATPDGDPVRVAAFIGAVRTFDEVADLLRRYRVDVAVVDAMPEIRMAQGLRDQFVEEGGCQVWLARFHPTPRVGVQRYGMRLDYQTNSVTVDRTQVFDATFDDIRGGTRLFPEDVFTVFAWADQMRAPVRVLDEQKQRIRWDNGSNPDHYRLADVYDRIAHDLMDLGGSYSAV
jgi:hypothetical protein